MEYDIVFVTGELYFDHPLSGIAVLKRLLEKYGYKVGIIEMPQKDTDIKRLGKPKLFFGVSSGSIDSMVRNYTPLKKPRAEDKHLNYKEEVPDRAVIVYSNWIRKFFKDSVMILGGTEASLRRFVHYDYWNNCLRKPILFDSRADLLVFGSAEKQILEIADKVKNKQSLGNIPGTCLIVKEKPIEAIELPSYEEVLASPEKFCDMQNLLSNKKELIQKIDGRYVLQHRIPAYTSQDLEEYYDLPFTRKNLSKHLHGFEFSIVTHRGCIGECNFCSLTLTQGNKIISRSEESIIEEVKRIVKLPHFRGIIDDLGGPSANMYGMDCHLCERSCLDCSKLDRSNKRLIGLLKKIRSVKGVKKVYLRSGIRFDLASPEYLKEIVEHHLSGTLKIAPEHVNGNVLKLMNKDRGDLYKFIKEFRNTGTRAQLAFYFMTAHPGSTIKEAKELAEAIKKLRNAEAVQIFTPTPMTVSTCMYHTGLDPKTKKKIHVPYTYSEKKEQKRVIMGDKADLRNDQ